MQLVYNETKKNHLTVITDLIEPAKRIVICSGWIKSCGLTLLLPVIDRALARNASIIIYTNIEHTPPACARALAIRQGLQHIIAPSRPYLHTKLYYVETASYFKAILGSANITAGAFRTNEELSIVLEGELGTVEHTNILDYLARLGRYHNG